MGWPKWKLPFWSELSKSDHSGWNTVKNKYFCNGWLWNPSFMLFPLLQLHLALQTPTFLAARARNDQLQLIWAENEGAEFWCDFLMLCWAAAPVAVSSLGYHHLLRSSVFWLLSCLISWVWSPAPHGLAEHICELNYPSWFVLNKLETRTVGLGFIFEPLLWALIPELIPCPPLCAALQPAEPAAHPALRRVH